MSRDSTLLIIFALLLWLWLRSKPPIEASDVNLILTEPDFEDLEVHDESGRLSFTRW